jgi:hypothetical protein
MTVARVVVDRIGMGESARWHDGRLWFADWTSLTICVLDTVSFDQGSFSCVVGDGTLYALTADWPAALNPGAEPSGRVMAAELS